MWSSFSSQYLPILVCESAVTCSILYGIPCTLSPVGKNDTTTPGDWDQTRVCSRVQKKHQNDIFLAHITHVAHMFLRSLESPQFETELALKPVESHYLSAPLPSDFSSKLPGLPHTRAVTTLPYDGEMEGSRSTLWWVFCAVLVSQI